MVNIGYHPTSIRIVCVLMTVHFGSGSLSNPLDIRMNWAGDQKCTLLIRCYKLSGFYIAVLMRCVVWMECRRSHDRFYLPGPAITLLMKSTKISSEISLFPWRMPKNTSQSWKLSGNNYVWVVKNSVKTSAQLKMPSYIVWELSSLKELTNCWYLHIWHFRPDLLVGQ